jgi:glutamyl-tRNA reductase
VHKIDNVYVYNVDDLERQVADGLRSRHGEVEAADAIVVSELLAFAQWARGLDAQPAIVALRAKTRGVLHAELERTLGGRLKHLPEGDRAALAQMIESAANKLLHGVTTKLKAGTESGDGVDLVRAARVLFDLPDVPSDADKLRGATDPPAQFSNDDDDERVTH